jgi:hypothetical protein
MADILATTKHTAMIMFIDGASGFCVPSSPETRRDMHELVHARQSTVNMKVRVVLATGPNSRFGSGSGSDLEPDRCHGFSPKTWHFKSTIVSPIKYLSSDRIVT